MRWTSPRATAGVAQGVTFLARRRLGEVPLAPSCRSSAARRIWYDPNHNGEHRGDYRNTGERTCAS